MWFKHKQLKSPLDHQHVTQRMFTGFSLHLAYKWGSSGWGGGEVRHSLLNGRIYHARFPQVAIMMPTICNSSLCLHS